jgi:hypothetical protein
LIASKNDRNESPRVAKLLTAVKGTRG